jgi:hypothetical protein
MIDDWPHGDPRSVARAIVADRRYEHGSSPVAQPSLLDLLVAWVARALHALLLTIDRALGSRNPFETAIGYAVIAAAFALLGAGSYALARSYLRRPRAGRHAAGTAAAREGEQPAGALRARAIAAARAGRYREAAALLFAAAVRALDERGRLAYDAARTPGEYRRLVRDPCFDVLANEAVTALFAAAEPSAELFERMSGAYEQLFDARAR